MKFFFKTFGCKINQCESNELINKLEKIDFELADDISDSDLLIINSCAVTKKAIDKLKKYIRRVVKVNEKIKIALTGCGVNYNMKFNYLKNLEKQIGREIFLKISNDNKFNLVNSLKKYFNDKIKINNKQSKNQNGNMFYKHTRAMVKIQDGCNNFCSYCIVPYLRNDLSYKPEDEVIKEIENYLKNGYKEIVLTGIELGKYGDKKDSLYKLLKRIIVLPYDFRVRLSSLNPDKITDKLIHLIKQSEKICNHLHMSLQSGNNKILKMMNRKYKVEEYFYIVKKLYDSIPEIGISTDVIVGFPGETEDDFNETCKFIEKCGFNRIHIFRYSDREGTAAFNFKNKVSSKEKKVRYRVLNDLAKKLAKRFVEKMLGKQYKVLIEKYDKGYVEGYTDNYIKVKSISNNLEHINKYVDVIITSYDKKNGIFGKI